MGFFYTFFYRRNVIRKIIFCLWVILIVGINSVHAQKKDTIVVVSDDNYPPYIFRDDNGKLQGILIDQWELFAKYSAHPVKWEASNWDHALSLFVSGKGDVLETAFYTENRSEIFSYSKPYARIKVPVFYEKGLSGIVNTNSLKGFAVGVKSGDACIEMLRKKGVVTFRMYDSYEKLIDASGRGEVKVFCVDEPPAIYYLNLKGLAGKFKMGFVLYEGEFHRVVRKGEEMLLSEIQEHFDQIPESKTKEIYERWMGKEIVSPVSSQVWIFLGILGGILLIVFIYAVLLNIRVRHKTKDLNVALSELSYRHEQNQKILNQVEEAVFVIQDEKIVFANEACARFSGTPLHRIIDSPVSVLASDDQKDILKDSLKKLKQENLDYIENIVRYHGAGNQIKYLKIQTGVIDWLGNEAVINVAIDITDTKQVLDDLTIKGSQLSHILNNIPGVVLRCKVSLDLDRHILYASNGIYELTGFYPDEIETLDCRNLVATESFEEFALSWRRSFTRKSLFSLEYCIVDRQGRKKNVWEKGNFFEDDRGDFYYEGYISDITMRVEAFNLLRQSERSYKEIFNSSNEAIVLHDAGSGDIVDFNDSFVELYGFPDREIAKKANLATLSAGDEVYNFENAIKKIKGSLTAGPQTFEWLAQKYNGDKVWLEVSLKHTEINGDDVVLAVVRDINERKMVQDSLRLQKEKLAQLYNSMIDSFVLFRIIKDSDGDYSDYELLDMNPVFCQMCGKDENELKGLLASELFHSTPPLFLDSFAQIGSTGIPLSFQAYINQWKRHFRISAFSPEQDFVAVLLQDITTLINTQHELQSGRESYKGLFNSIQQAIFIHDERGRVIDVNPGVVKMYGYNFSEMIGKKLEFFAAEGMNDFGSVNRDFELALNGVPSHFEFWGKRKNSEVFPEEVWLNPGNYFGKKVVVAVASDISERKNRERNIVENEMRLKAITDNANEGIVIVDSNGKIVFLNPAAYRICEISDVDTIDLDFYNFFTPYLKENFHENIFTDGRFIDAVARNNIYEGKISLANRKVIDVNVSLSNVILNNEPHVIGIFRDISQQKQLENQLIAAKIASEKANEVKSLFLANMSHELRTPLNAMIGFTQLLSGTKLDEVQQQYLNNSLISANALMRLIEEVLDISKIESGEIVFESTKIDLFDLLNNTMTIMQNHSREKGLELLAECDMFAPRYLVGDATRLRQIMLNLLQNAVKYTEKGYVKISLSSRPSDVEDFVMVRIVVSDSGIGIPKEKLSTIFLPFTQTDASNTRKHGGIGLGLSIVNKLTLLLGGTISVESRLNEGSSFIVELPMKQSPQESPKIINRKLDNALIINASDHSSSVIINALKYGGVKYFRNLKSNVIQDVSYKENEIVIIDADYRFENLKEIFCRYKYEQMVFVGQSENLKLVKSICYWEKTIYIEKPFSGCLFFETIFLKEPRSNMISSGLNEEPLLCNGVRLLIVEDNKMNRLMIKTLIKKFFTDLNIDEAGDGLEALCLFEKNRPEVILMDLQMPEMDGFEASKAIRDFESKNKVNKPSTIIALTAAAFQSEKIRCHESGMDDFITKPIDQKVFCERLKSVLQGYLNP